MKYDSKAFLAYKSRPKWRNKLFSIALMSVWLIGFLSVASFAGQNPLLQVLLGLIFNGFMFVLIFEFTDLEKAVKEINQEAVNLMEEIEWCKSQK